MKGVAEFVQVLNIYCFLGGFIIAWLMQQTVGNWNDTPPLPRFLPVPRNVTYFQGESAVLFCAVENLGTKTVTWRKIPYITPIITGRKVFVTDKRFVSRYIPFKNEWNLVIQNVRMFDAGVYECQVSARGRTLRQNVTLNVLENIESLTPEIRINGTRFVEKGDPIHLVCNATGEDYAPDKIEWYKNGDLLYTDLRNRVYIKNRISHHSKTLISILKISHSKMTDSGNFVCRTSNKLTTGIKVEVLNDDFFDYHSSDYGSYKETHNSGTSNVKRGTLNKTSRTETLNTKDAAMFLQSTAGTICCLIVLQHLVKYFIFYNPWNV